MSEPAQVATPPDPEGPERADADLISAARDGDAEAYGVLYERHARAVRALARQMARDEAESDDLVAETFARVLDVLRRGGGPEVSFRAYALTALRRIKYDRARGETVQVVLDDLDPYAPGVPFDDPALEGLERSMVARAFASLPERWQTVLWHTAIEGERPAQVAPLLGISAGSVAALAYRAREGLRQAYLQMHLSGAVQEGCQPALERMGAYVRGGLARRETRAVERHLDECGQCRALYLELADVNASLRTVIGPIILGPAVGGYLASVHGGGAFSLLLLQQLRRVPKQAAAAAAVVVALAVGLPLGWMAWQGDMSGHPGDGQGAAAQAQAPRRPPAEPRVSSDSKPRASDSPPPAPVTAEARVSSGDGAPPSPASGAGPAPVSPTPTAPSPPSTPHPPRAGAPPESPPPDRPGQPPRTSRPSPPPDSPPRRGAPPEWPAPPDNPPPSADKPTPPAAPPSPPVEPPTSDRPDGPTGDEPARRPQRCSVGVVVGPIDVCVRLFGHDAPEVRVTVEPPASP